VGEHVALRPDGEDAVHAGLDERPQEGGLVPLRLPVGLPLVEEPPVLHQHGDPGAEVLGGGQVVGGHDAAGDGDEGDRTEHALRATERHGDAGGHLEGAQRREVLRRGGGRRPASRR
jgi:hypothetical protein